jgi:hypothetical protein
MASMTNSSHRIERGRNAPFDFPHTNNAGMKPVYESLFSRTQADGSARRQRAREDTSLVRPSGTRHQRRLNSPPRSDAIPRA